MKTYISYRMTYGDVAAVVDSKRLKERNSQGLDEDAGK